MTQNSRYGIKGQIAPDLKISTWIDGNGETIDPLNLSDFEDKVIYLLAFQSWCPGCHSVGFPTLQKVQETFENNKDVAFLVVQTVFEGHHTNTPSRLKETQEKYQLKIPFGHDEGNPSDNRRWPNLMIDYKTGGTPWVIIIGKDKKVLFNDYHVKEEEANRIIKNALNQK